MIKINFGSTQLLGLIFRDLGQVQGLFIEIRIVLGPQINPRIDQDHQISEASRPSPRTRPGETNRCTWLFAPATPCRQASRQGCRLGLGLSRQACRQPCRHGLGGKTSRLAPDLISKTVSEIQIPRNLLWAFNGSYGPRFSKTRTLFRVFFRDERNGIACFT